MTTLREAAQQALGALEGWDNYGKWVWPESALEQAKRNTTESLAALRAALAEPTPLEDVVTHGSAWSKNGKRIDPMSVYAEPAQEPVAWMYDFLNPDNREEAIRNWVTQNPVEIEREKGFNVRPLYTAPPQRKPRHVSWVCPQCYWSLDERKPLTEEEISNIWDRHIVPVFGKNGINPIVFARAIERAHGIGEAA